MVSAAKLKLLKRLAELVKNLGAVILQYAVDLESEQAEAPKKD